MYLCHVNQLNETILTVCHRIFLTNLILNDKAGVRLRIYGTELHEQFASRKE